MSHDERLSVSPSTVTKQLHDLGVLCGGVLLVHTSFRATGPIEGGPLGLLAALRDALGPDGTLVMPSWSSCDDEPFDPATSPVPANLGVVAHEFWRVPEVQRAEHVHAFAAVGPRAAYILSDPLPLPPHIPASPVGRVHELDGQVLLLGVNHDANTTIHLAELRAEVPYRTPKYCTVEREGRWERVDYDENDHCCARFVLVDDWLRELGTQSEGPVGHGQARLVRSRAVVDAVEARLSADPLFFLHAQREGCAECNQARASVAARGA